MRIRSNPSPETRPSSIHTSLRRIASLAHLAICAVGYALVKDGVALVLRAQLRRQKPPFSLP